MAKREQARRARTKRWMQEREREQREGVVDVCGSLKRSGPGVRGGVKGAGN